MISSFVALRVPEGDVLEDGSVEEDGVLEDVADLVAKRLDSVVAHVFAVDQDAAGVGVVEARNQADDGRFAAARGADDADELAGLDVEGDVGEDGGLGVVAEGHVAEFDLALEGLGLEAVGRLGNDRCRCRGWSGRARRRR